MTARTSPRRVTHRAVPPVAGFADAKSRAATGTPWNSRPSLSGAQIARIVDIRPTRHVVISAEPALPLWQVLVMFAAAAFIGVLLATGGVL